MKKIFIFLTALILGFTLTQCKKGGFLDSKSTGLTEATTFSDSTNTVAFLTRIYEDAPFAYYKYRWDNGGLEQGTDDSEFTLGSPARRSNIISMGLWNPDNAILDFWSTPWTDIRRVNLLLSQLPLTPLSAARKQLIAGEARFLRAWFYENLVINFGGVPLIGDQVYGIDDIVNVPRSSFADCVTYIDNELDAAAKLLPQTRADIDYGRITSGACLGLKARMLLYAASPLFNGPSYVPTTSADQAKVVGYGTYDVARWQAAADAALAVINVPGNPYSLYVDNTTAPGYGFYQVFLNRVNPEFMFVFNRPANRDFEGFYNPSSRGGNKYGQPTQNIVDCFPMSNGKAITDPTSGYNPANPYVNREPRFNYSIIYNGSNYYLQSASAQSPVFTYINAPTDGFPSTLTGYYSRKMCDVTISNNSSFNTQRSWSLMRYAEILLSYAEAINETGQTSLAYPMLQQIRQRAGIAPGTNGLYGMTPNMSVSDMRTFIQNERRIELMNENFRWDDVRRWKIAMVTQNGLLNYMAIVKNANGTFTYNIINANTPPPLNPSTPSTSKAHVFYPNDYLLSIQRSEILKAPALIQNPGYN